MNKASKLLIAISLIAIIMASGCVFPETEAVEIAKRDPVASDFLAEHINAQPTVALWTRADTRNRIDYLFERCGPSQGIFDYYYVTFKEEGAVLELWVYKNSMTVACTYRSDDECVVDWDCDDGSSCTIENCSGTPKRCNRESITSCIGGDNCCPGICSFSVDSDCEEGECVVHTDCNDRNPGTRDFCTGIPKECSHEPITECESGDSYCPPGCNFSNDTDCSVGVCEKDKDCDDQDPGTRDFCRGSPSFCYHENVAECGAQDSFCPPGCDRGTDGDCFAGPGDRERIILNCEGFETVLTSKLERDGEELTASFDKLINSSNNGDLKTYNNRKYKYNNVKDYSSPMSEKIIIQGQAFYDKELQESFFKFNKSGIKYEVNIPNGIPATGTWINQKPFVTGNDDTIEIPLFGDDAFVRSIDMDLGEIKLISDANEIKVEVGQGVNVEGTNGEEYRMRILNCDDETAIFGLFEGTKLLKNQEVGIAGLIFEEDLKKKVMLSYLHFDSIRKNCDFRYVKGLYLETMRDGEEFAETGWTSYLAFEGNRLRKIELKDEKAGEIEALARGETMKILPFGNSTAVGFCTLKFTGLFR